MVVFISENFSRQLPTRHGRKKCDLAGARDPRIAAHMRLVDGGADHFGVLEGVGVALASFGQPRNEIGDRRYA